MFGAIDYGKPIGERPEPDADLPRFEDATPLTSWLCVDAADCPSSLTLDKVYAGTLSENGRYVRVTSDRGQPSFAVYRHRFVPYTATIVGAPRFEEATPAPDMVHQPNHYARYVIEPVTFIGANKLPFDVGNVIKYVCRYDAKNGIEDLEKAKRYVEIVIERVKREARIDNGERAETVWSEII